MVATGTVEVVVPTWNRRDLVLGLLESLAGQGTLHTVHVVDNGSTDGTAEAVRRGHPDVVVHALADNLGFGAAVNVGIRAGTADVVVVTNNDVVAEPGFLQALAAPFADPAVGSVAGVLLDGRGERIDAAGVVVDRGLAGYSHLHGLALSALPGASPPLGPCGGAAAYRRTALEEVGLFDEQFFAYSEDVDLALRLAAAGWACAPAPDARARHLGSATLGHRTTAQLRRSAWGRGYLMGRYRVRPGWVALEAGVGLLDVALSRSSAPAVGRLRGYRAGRHLPRRATPVMPDALTARDALGRRWASTRG